MSGAIPVQWRSGITIRSFLGLFESLLLPYWVQFPMASVQSGVVVYLFFLSPAHDNFSADPVRYGVGVHIYT